MTIRSVFTQNILLPLSDFLRDRHLNSVFKFLKKSQWYDYAELVNYQEKKLIELINYAYHHCPYYNTLLNKYKLKPEDINSISTLRKLPFLTKNEIRANYPEGIVAENVSQNGWRYQKTGGSTTGEPLITIEDKDASDWGRASFYRGWSFMGWKVGDPAIKLWGQSVLNNSKSPSISEKLIQEAINLIPFDAFKMDDRLFNQCYLYIQSKKVKFIYSYVSALMELCKYIEKNKLSLPSIEGVLTTAEVLLPDKRNYIEQVLKVPVYNGYACGEINGIAYECSHRKGLHISMERAVIEIVDEKGDPMPFGEKGRIAITDLHNKAMPLIRYVNGDEGIITNETCDCGRNHLRFKEISGRTLDNLTGVNGKKIHGYYFASLFGELNWREKYGLEQFQIIQESEKNMEIRLLIENKPEKFDEEKLTSILKEYLGEMNIKIEYNKALEKTISGKLRWTINKVKS